MEWEHRDFNSKSDKECEENPNLIVQGNVQVRQRRDVEGVRPTVSAVPIIEKQDAEQHQHRAGQRVEEKLDCGVKLLRAAPDADQEVHRYQHYFPQDVEHEEVLGHEDAEHAGLQNQQKDVIFLDALLDGAPR